MQGQREDFDSCPNVVDCEQEASSESDNELNLQSSLHPNLMPYAGVDQDVRILRGKVSGGISSYSLEEMDGSGFSISCWGQSSKRKLHEGSSSESYTCGTSGSVTENQNSMNHGIPSNSAFDTINHPLNPMLSINGSAGNPAQSDVILPLYTDEDASEFSLSDVRNMRYPHDSMSSDSSDDDNSRQSIVPMYETSSQSRLHFGSLRLRSSAVVRPNSRSLQIRPEDASISHPSSGVHTLRHRGNSISRSASRSRTSSSSRHSSPPPPWIRPLNPPQIHQRLSVYAPQTLFPSYDTEIRNHSSHSPPLPLLNPCSTPDAASPRPSSHNVQQAHRRLGSMPERQDDAFIRLPHLLREMAADMEGRRMFFSEIRQLLDGGRRDNLQIEDYMLFDPFIYHGLAEIHDRHRDMRLDVDNMSYEELLALGEQIGDVNTGLSEEIIMKTMKKHQYVQETVIAVPDVEPCCVCQEEFLPGEDLGKLDCGHDFHVHCVKQWLMLKNICPICKTTGLGT